MFPIDQDCCDEPKPARRAATDARISCGTAIKKDILCECRLTRFAATRFSFAGRVVR